MKCRGTLNWTLELIMNGGANGIGWFSIGLGTAQLLAPDRLARMIGVGEHSGTMRAMGIREIASGIGVLAQRRPRASLWARVAGDALDLVLLTEKLGQRNTRKARIAGAAAMVLAVGALDYLYAREATAPSLEDE